MSDHNFLRYVPDEKPAYQGDFYIGMTNISLGVSELYVWKGPQRFSLGRVGPSCSESSEDPFVKLVREIQAAEREGYKVYRGLPPDVERLRVDIDLSCRPLTRDELALFASTEESMAKPSQPLRLTERLT